MIIYFDMDGVIADWVDGFERKFPEISYAEFNSMSDDERDVYRSVLDADPDFYSSLEPIVPVLKVMKSCLELGYDVQILTSVGEEFPELISQQKIEWIQKHVGNVPVNIVNKSSHKARYASPEAILIDDRSKSIDPFIAAGGHGILFDGLVENSALVLASLLSMKIESVRGY